MTTKSFLIGCSLVALSTASAWAEGSSQRGWAEIKDASGKTVGAAVLTEEKDGVLVNLKVSGLKPGLHAFHVHENGDCTGPDFKSAGGHFNPFHKHHGVKNPEGKHAGDMPNLEVQPDGSARASVLAEGTTLGPGPGSLLKPGGTALVIHASPDDNLSDPAGNAGARVACGVIRAKAE